MNLIKTAAVENYGAANGFASLDGSGKLPASQLPSSGFVSSIFGRSGSVTAQSGDYTTDQVTEGSNLYYTASRFNTAFAAKSTTDLSEGTNLYFTTARAQAITKLTALTTNGFVKTTSSDGTLSVDTNTYLTGNQTITLSGDVSGSGATSITATLGNIPANVGTTLGSDATGDLYYRNSGGKLTRLGIGSSNQVLTVVGGLPSWQPSGGAVTSVFGRTGVVTAQSGDYDTSQVTENTNLYFTNSRAISATLTGYTSGAGTISSSDSILQAIQKLNGNVGLKQNSFTWKQQVFSGDGSTVNFTLTNTPVSQSACIVFVDVTPQLAGTGFTTSGTTLTMGTAPAVGQDILVIYTY